jgi:hypothetical protein
MHEDPVILHYMLGDRDRRIYDLEDQLRAARAHAINWEHEAKSLRKEIQRLRMSADTERIAKS